LGAIVTLFMKLKLAKVNFTHIRDDMRPFLGKKEEMVLLS